ncbi:Major allergen Pru ar 1 [Forsythia ovata]|uniref:Major allergen Pru ar 1 n=1 Tax=Forsythia ovata TaxID=205694 RepID=A0ABD1PHV8_9LAMI
MGVIETPLEFKVGFSAARMFKALIIESYTLLPEMMPTAIKKYELLHGDGGVGSIAQTTFHDDSVNGECIIKIIIDYHTKGDAELKEEEIKAIKDQALGFYTVIEEYLLAHPDVCV